MVRARAAAILDGHALQVATALASGWPISTGVIEGARRHLVKDRTDSTGARWKPRFDKTPRW